MRFCGGCGSSLEQACGSCGGENPPQFKFCGHCGSALAAAATPERDTADRRQLTVMFVDMVGSTALSARLDPEDLRDVIRDYQQAVSGAAQRYEGHVAQHLGDGLLIYFGYPRAHEDDARRAVHAALGVVDVMATLNERLRQRDLEIAVRVGIHTGPVVAGALGAGETGSTLALGQTPNVAAGLEGVAAPNGVVLSAATHELVEGFFACRPLGPKKLKTTSKPVEVYEVVGESGVRSRFELAMSQGLGPLIGRRRQLVRMRDRFYVASEGRGQVVEISGEGGIGKSRQVYELRKMVAMMPHAWLTCRTSPYAGDQDFHPFIEYLFEHFGLHHEDSPEDKLAKLRRGLERLGAPPESVPHVARLLAVAPAAGILEGDVRQGRETISEVLLAALLQRPLGGIEGGGLQAAGEQVLVLFVEDLQWADPASVDLLERLVEALESAPILAVFTYRRAFRPPWPELAYRVRILLERLEGDEEEMMVEEVTQGKLLPRELLDQILDQADGVPLFIEEMTRMVLDSDQLEETEDGYELTGGAEVSLGIPTSLQGALMARLDRDPEAKELAQLAAALDREFGFDVLRAVSRLDDATLGERLRRLVAEDILAQFGEPPLASYSFRHALIRAAAYQSVLKSTRPQYHQGVAEALIELIPEVAESDPGLVAHHLRRARRPELAVDYYLRAGRQALRQGRYGQAKERLGRGLESAAALPAGEQQAREIAFHCGLATAFAATGGLQAPEVADFYERAHELCRAPAGESPELFWVLRGRWLVEQMRPDLETALAAATDLFELASTRGDPETLAQGHLALGSTQLFLGNLTPAGEHLEEALALDNDGSAPAADGWLLAVGVVEARACLSLVLWHQGYPGRALAESVAAIAQARRLRHPFSLAYALTLGAWLHACRGEEELVRECANELISLAERHRIFLAVWGRLFLNVWKVVDPAAAGGWSAGSAGLVQRRSHEVDVGAALGTSTAASLIATQAAAEGHVEEAVSRLEATLDVIRRSGERHWEAELLRCRGELLLAAGDDDGSRHRAESDFTAAITTARRQGSRSLELRAATSLARLRQRQERYLEARQHLSVVYDAYPEKGDSPDVEEAAALLA